MILITGSTGTVGSAVVQELMERGHSGQIRAMYRNEKDRVLLPPGVEAVRADFREPDSLLKALDGVAAAYLVCAPVPDLVALESNFLEACRAGKTRHIVINSALGAEDFPKAFPSWHRKVEDKARQMGLPVVIVRPNGFMQNIQSYFAPTIRSQNAFYGTIGDAKISLIDVRDVAAAAVTALLTENLSGRTFELSGPEAVSYAELAERISTRLGRAIRYVNLTPSQMIQAMTSAGMPALQASAVVDLDEYYRSGKGAATDQPLRELIDREPRRLDHFLDQIAPQL
jgi:uncharacterized protein YbjT (DUF2867 family)